VHSANLDRPLIRVIRDNHGQEIEPFEIDLRKEPDIEIRCLGIS